MSKNLKPVLIAVAGADRHDGSQLRGHFDPPRHESQEADHDQ
jgi:hypothetical protein